MLDAFIVFVAGFVTAIVAGIASWFVAPGDSSPVIPDRTAESGAEIREVEPPPLAEPEKQRNTIVPPAPKNERPVADVPAPTSRETPKSLSVQTPPPAPTGVSASTKHEEDSTRRVESTPGAMKFVNPETNVLEPSGVDAKEIARLTNEERARVGAPPLVWNARLAAMAEAKNVDMISRQYFAHVSPTGRNIGDLAEQYGYSYRRVGENLALGDFASSSHIVTGWMRSPGHRENILEPEFTEIGVSVMRGMWEGREVWWATQEFGRPMPVCPEPDELLRKKIEIFDGQLSALKGTLDRARAELDTISNPSLLRQKVEEYNLLVDLFNKLLETQKMQVAEYNADVAKYNSCIAK